MPQICFISYFCSRMLMKSNITRPLIAFLLCGVMIVGITPKRTIHEIFGCHNTSGIKTERSASHHTQFNKDGFHCSCEQQEFQAGFIPAISLELPQVPVVYLSQYHPQLQEQFSVKPVTQPSLRGPPSAA